MAGSASSPDLDRWLASQLRTGIAGWRPGSQGFEQVLAARRRRLDTLRRNALSGGLALVALGLFLYTLVPSPGGTMGYLVGGLFGGLRGAQAAPMAVAPLHARPSGQSAPPPRVPPSDRWYHLRQDSGDGGSEALSRPPAAGSGQESQPAAAAPRDSSSTLQVCAWTILCQGAQASSGTGDGSMSAQQMADALALAERYRAARDSSRWSP